MESYCGEFMNNHRDAMASHAADVRAEQEQMIAAGAHWYSVLCEDATGDRFSVDVIAFSRDEAIAEVNQNCSGVTVVDAVTEEEAAAA